MEFKKAVAIGTGMMGPGIAVSFALGGLEATIVGRSEESSSKGLANAQEQLKQLQEHNLVSPEAAVNAFSLLRASHSVEKACADADIVVESVPEKLVLKQELFERLELVVKPETVLASNTSGLSITAIAAGCQRSERIMTAHFWNPPHVMPLVELVRGEKTSRPLMEDVRSLLQRCGKTAVIVDKDRRGQLGNRLQMALWREAIHIVEEGIATVEEVDLAVKTGFGLRLPVLGIFEHADAVGLDMVADIMDYVGEDLYHEPKAPPLLRRTIQDGKMGVKTGSGFYDWSRKNIDDVKAGRDRFLYEFLSARSNKPV